MLGKILDGRYRIERLLGTGGMGSVYAAEDLRGGGVVAVKVIHRHLAEGTAVVQRFQREAQAAGSIDTEHIARCFATGTDPESGSPYMVLEYLLGEDLQHLIRRLGPLRPEAALRIVAQACVGVSKAHEAGVVHRDIKPANIFLAKGEGGACVVKVLDFGVAKIRRDDDVGAGTTGGLTRTGSLLGSPLYMSPEQARSVKNVDHRSDLWSLGVVLYQAVAGRTPHEDISGLGDLILALCSDLPTPVQRFAPWVTPEVAAVIDRALRVLPAERFQTAAEMLGAIDLLLPGGHALRDEMLVPLDEAIRGRVAGAFVGRPAVGLGRTPSAAALASTAEAPAPGEASRSSDGADPRPASTSTSQSGPPPAVASTQSAVATTGPGGPDAAADARPPVPAPRQVPILAMAIACVVAGGSAVYAFTRPSAAPVAPAAVTAPTAATPTTPVLTTTAAPPPTTLPAPPETAPPAPSQAPTTTASAATPAVPGPLHSAAALRPRPAPAPSASAPRAGPLDYSSFGGRK